MLQLRRRVDRADALACAFAIPAFVAASCCVQAAAAAGEADGCAAIPAHHRLGGARLESHERSPSSAGRTVENRALRAASGGPAPNPRSPPWLRASSHQPHRWLECSSALPQPLQASSRDSWPFCGRLACLLRPPDDGDAANWMEEETAARKAAQGWLKAQHGHSAAHRHRVSGTTV